jgi:hypothetical protein
MSHPYLKLTTCRVTEQVIQGYIYNIVAQYQNIRLIYCNKNSLSVLISELYMCNKIVTAGIMLVKF